MIRNSIIPPFYMENRCQVARCTYTISSNYDSTWPIDASVSVLVNGVKTTFIGYDQNFEVSRGDSITFDNNGRTKEPLSVVIKDGNDIVFTWIQDNYASPILIDNPCTVPRPYVFPPSPFGGQLYPITNEQIQVFLAKIRSTSPIWFPLTSETN